MVYYEKLLCANIMNHNKPTQQYSKYSKARESPTFDII